MNSGKKIYYALAGDCVTVSERERQETVKQSETVRQSQETETVKRSETVRQSHKTVSANIKK
jgi:hypothetical protein